MLFKNALEHTEITNHPKIFKHTMSIRPIIKLFAKDGKEKERKNGKKNERRERKNEKKKKGRMEGGREGKKYPCQIKHLKCLNRMVSNNGEELTHG